MPLDKSCNASIFVPKSSKCVSFFRSLFNQSAHTHTRVRTQGIYEVYVDMIVPSRHMSWWSAKGALFWKLDVILFWDTIHEKSFKQNVQCSKLGVSIQRWCICMAKSSVRPQTVQSKEVFIQRRCSIFTCFTVFIDLGAPLQIAFGIFFQ